MNLQGSIGKVAHRGISDPPEDIHRKLEMTPEALRIAINRLSLRIVRETGGQDVCDRLERELAALVAMVTA